MTRSTTGTCGARSTARTCSSPGILSQPQQRSLNSESIFNSTGSGSGSEREKSLVNFLYFTSRVEK